LSAFFVWQVDTKQIRQWRKKKQEFEKVMNTQDERRKRVEGGGKRMTSEELERWHSGSRGGGRFLWLVGCNYYLIGRKARRRRKKFLGLKLFGCLSRSWTPAL
jgi:hypothetical protein